MKFAGFLSDHQIFDNGHEKLTPKASIVMPTYARNTEGLLAPCLDSVLAQTFTDFEFIIIDDGSSDGSEQLIKQYAAADPRIVYVRHSQNSGLPAVRTDEGILLARAPYVAFIFDDNLWYPDALESMVSALENSDAELVYGHVLMPRTDADPVAYGITPPTLEILRNANIIPNGVVAVRRSFFDKVGLYDPHLVLRRICDWDLWLRAAKMNIPMGFIDRVLGVEQGIVSPSSLGNTVKLDFKISLAYMSDDCLMASRCAALTPAAISDYDPFDVEKIIPYVRNLMEWQQLEDEVYTPFFDRHPYYTYLPLLKNNRRYDLNRSGYRINPVAPIFKHRNRIAIVSNRVNRFVQDWYEAVSADPDNIVILLNQVSFDLVTPQDMDLVILIDICSALMVSQLESYTDMKIPIMLIVAHGLDMPIEDSNPLKFIDIDIPTAYSKMLGWPVYVPNPGVAWSPDMLRIAKSIAAIVDQVVVVDGAQIDRLTGFQNFHTLPFIANVLSEDDDQSFQPDLVAYLGDPQMLSTATLIDLRNHLSGTLGTLYLYPGAICPKQLSLDSLTLKVTLDSPATFVNKLWAAQLLLPVEIWNRLPAYHQKMMEEDLAQKRCSLILLGTEKQFINSPETDLALSKRLSIRSLGLPRGARHLHLRNLVMGVGLRRKIATHRRQTRARETKSMVFINSQALAGAEAYGLLIGYALRQIGFDVQVCTHASYDLYPQGFKDLENWLSSHKMSPLLEAEYGKVVRSLHLPEFPETDLQTYSDALDQWLEDQEIGLVFSAGFISEPVLGGRGNRLNFMALFAPWDYPLNRMTYLRGKVAGLISDTRWAANLWARWMLPPVDCIPSLVEPDLFTVQNNGLPDQPVCIAVTGTIQPRKRQKEAVQAILALIYEGYDIRLNLYGYLMYGLTAYIDEIKQLAENPNLKGRVFFHGFVEDVQQIARENHIILSTSADESLPQSILFNQASGLVAVACPAGGIAEIVEDEVTGYLAQDFSPQGIVDALRKAIKSRDQWPHLIQHARARIAERCSEPVFTNRLLKVMLSGAEIQYSEGARLFQVEKSNLSEQSWLLEDHPAIRTGLDEGNLTIGPDLTLKPIVYRMFVTESMLWGLQFRVGTYLTRPKGNLVIEISRLNERKVLRRVELLLDHITDNAWTKMSFEPISGTANQWFQIKISANALDGRIAIYETIPQRFLKINKIKVAIERRLIHFIRFPRSFPAIFPRQRNG